MCVLGDEGTDRGYLDHLSLDQDGVPTLVEFRRTCYVDRLDSVDDNDVAGAVEFKERSRNGGKS